MSLSRRVLINDLLRALSFGATVLVGGLGIRSASSRTKPSAATDRQPDGRDWVLRVRDGAGYERAFVARCPHLGCKVERDTDGKGLTCPCHGSRFDLHGRRIAGPAKLDLEGAG
jgi:Rieske Fe-S protein